MKIALIAGATGLVGGKLLNLLLSSTQFDKVISIGRREVPLKNAKLENCIVDFEELDTLNIKVDVVFCCLGTTIKKAGSQDAFRKVDLEFPKNIASYASKIGATSFHLISSIGANSTSSVFYNKVKGEVENAISSFLFKQTHIYRPSMLLGKRNETRFLESVGIFIFKLLQFLFVGSLKNYKAIEAQKVAEFMFQCSLLDTEGVFIHSSGEMQ